MPRSSSSSGSTPSRITPPSRATAGGSSTSAVVERVAEVRRDRRARRRGCGRAAPAARSSSSRTRGTAAIDWRSDDQIARPGGAERGARDQPLHVVHRLQRVADLGALGGAERELLDRVEPILDPLERQQRTQQPARAAAGRPSASPCDRSRGAASRRAPPLRGLDHLEVAQRGRIDRAGSRRRCGSAIVADVREVGLLRLAQVLDQRAGRADRRRGCARARSRRGCALAAGRAACGAPTRSRTPSRRPW